MSLHHAPGLFDQIIELGIGPNVELLEAVEELHEVVDCRVAEDLAVLAVGATQALSEMRHQLGQLPDERLLGHLHRFLEAAGNTGTFLLVQARAQFEKVVRRLDAREVPRDAEQVAQVWRVIARVVEITQRGAVPRS